MCALTWSYRFPCGDPLSLLLDEALNFLGMMGDTKSCCSSRRFYRSNPKGLFQLKPAVKGKKKQEKSRGNSDGNKGHCPMRGEKEGGHHPIFAALSSRMQIRAGRKCICHS